MVSSYKKIGKFIQKLGMYDISILLPSNAKDFKFDELVDLLRDLHSVSIYLQSELATISDACIGFDTVKVSHPDSHSCVIAEADIVFTQTFESALVKLRENRIFEISAVEADNVSCLKRVVDNPSSTRTDSVFFPEVVLKRLRLSVYTMDSEYMRYSRETSTARIYLKWK